MVGCPSCGRELPGEFAFCPHCGATLAASRATAVLEERKVVSVLFCDLVGFTAASDTADPEDVRARIRPYHARLREEIRRYGGTVDKFIGDGVMAVFGAPVAHEDDAERAVRAGLCILESIAQLNAAAPGLELEVRVGINTGEAMVALGAPAEVGEELVIGDVVNTASRLEGAAPVNGIAVSERTYRQTRRVFSYEPLEPAVVKGKAEPLRMWRPVAARALLGSDVTRTHTTPLVGRELEKPLLIGMFERAATQRSCQLVTLVGVPGVGKSRLCMELLGHVEDRPGVVRWRQGRCLPYGEGIAFWALGEIVKAESGILESDSPDVAAAKLEHALPADDPDLAWLRARVAPLVGVGGDPASPEESFTAWRRVLESWAAARPTVLVFEDLHWANAALLRFLEHLADWADDVPLLVLCTARPELYEQHPHFGATARNAQRINLAPLSDDETSALVASLLERTLLPARTHRALLERAGGNPLYAEEFVRLLADRAQAPEGVEVPDSVQALLAARLDTLSPDRKSLLQDAAVVGKVFWAGALCEIGGRDPRHVDQALHELARKELVRPSRTTSMEGEAEYGFWHLLVRDVCYGQIPRAARAARHEAAAAWLERKAAERAEDLADVLAHHYLTALELARVAGREADVARLQTAARRYLTLAGERALGLDTAQAEATLAQALELTPADDPHRSGLLLRWVDALSQAGRPRDAAAALEDALRDFRERGDVAAEARALVLLSRVAWMLGEARHVALGAEAVRLLEQEPPGPALVDAYGELTGGQFIAGAHDEAVAAAERAIVLAQRLGLPVPARSLGFHGLARVYLGQPEGLAEMEQALALHLEQGAGRDTAVLMNNLVFARLSLEGPERSLAASEEGIAFSEQRGLAEMAAALESNCLGLLAELGRPEAALERAARLAVTCERSGDTPTLIEVRAVELALAVARGDDRDLDERTGWLVDTARQTAFSDLILLALGPAAEACLAQGRTDAARALLAELERAPRARGSPYYARQLAAMVRTAIAAGDAALARRLANGLEPIYPLSQYALCAARAQLAEAQGHHAGAAELYERAAERWRDFGNVVEQAHALVGAGRCLVALDDAGADVPLAAARRLFGSMGYGPALRDSETLLAQAHAVHGATP